MTSPSIKDALEVAVHYIEDAIREAKLQRRTCKVSDLEEVVEQITAALATLSPPDGERREAIRNLVRNTAMSSPPSDFGSYRAIEAMTDAILASGFVQDEAAIRADEREKCAKALDDIETDADGKCHWTDVALATAAIRSARDGGAS